MKLSDYKDEEALEVLADILEPTIDIMGDPKVAQLFSENQMVKAVKLAIKSHSKSVMELMAGVERVPVEEYHCDLFTLPKLLLDIFNDEGFMSFFSSQGQKTLEESSGSVMGNTEGTENTSPNT